MEIADDIRQKTTNSSDFEEVRLKMDRLELTKTLDAKLECYLKTLDEYDKIMKEISKLFSSVFAPNTVILVSILIHLRDSCHWQRQTSTTGPLLSAMAKIAMTSVCKPLAKCECVLMNSACSKHTVMFFLKTKYTQN